MTARPGRIALGLLIVFAATLGGCARAALAPDDRVVTEATVARSHPATLGPLWPPCLYVPYKKASGECRPCHPPAPPSTRPYGVCARGERIDTEYCDGCHVEHGKPVIYLYPPRAMGVRVNLDVAGRITVSDPPLDVDGGWDVVAHPNGDLLETRSGQTYPYLFWEAVAPVRYDLSEGTVVSGAGSRRFLARTLARLGLNDSEAREFIAYWAPRMEAHPYNMVRFEGPAYERVARLDVMPRPDTSIRVFMVFAPLDAPVDVRPQRLPDPPDRTGFVLVEWGGAELPGL